jgi:hypothetical protein
MRIQVRSNASLVEQRVRALGGQVVFAAAVSLTRGTKDAQTAIRAEMGRVFDRPTSYALNGTFLKAATKQNLEARLWVKDNPFGKGGTPADRFLLPHIYGGRRVQKGMERALQAAGLLPAGWVAIPAAGAQLDGNGNVRRGQITQILSQLQVQRKAGYESKRSNSAASRRTVARQGVTYFALPAATRGLQPGIYLKRKFAHGTAIRPVFIFVSTAQYSQRLKFFEIGRAVAEDRFRFHFDSEIRKAIASARLGSAG